MPATEDALARRVAWPSHIQRLASGAVGEFCDAAGLRSSATPAYSTADQHHEVQTDQLRVASCGRISTDTASGAKADRPALAAALDYARLGDTLVVVKLDRAGQSVPHLVALVANLETGLVGAGSR